MRSAWLVVLTACGPSARDLAMRESVDFRCRDRLASYVATKHMGGEEIGVQMDCVERGPRIKRWRMDRQGKRVNDEHSMSPTEFDSVWRELDGTGWPNLRDCGNGTGGKQDPIYTFDIKDDTNKATFQCQSRTMPYPYNSIVDPLDVAAQRDQKQLGDDEPADLKALEKQKPK
ncbi:MAG: hypothetical protein H0V17_00080 [Deltaproteobacteria bacterium]|nr:hypothetical protein [Deltaproteobacteria bacterium]